MKTKIQQQQQQQQQLLLSYVIIKMTQRKKLREAEMNRVVAKAIAITKYTTAEFWRNKSSNPIKTLHFVLEKIKNKKKKNSTSNLLHVS